MVAALFETRRSMAPVGDVRLFETHISWVLLAGQHAYKIKKALDVGFLDFTSLSARQYFCDEEVRLNSRMAPDIYQDVVPIGGTPEAPMIGVLPAIDYAVRMRRFSVDAELDKLIEAGQVSSAHIDSLAQVLARFHLSLPGIASDSPYGHGTAFCKLAMQNFTELPDNFTSVLGQFVVLALHDATEEEYAACEKLIEARRETGFVRECHGDLHLGNIVMIDAVATPFDGIEFDPGLRWTDIMADTAFPFMDLLYYARSDLAYRFLNAWLEETGDYNGVALLRLYACYRAAVRAKINALRASQPGISEIAQKRAHDAFYKYLSVACNCLVRHRPALIITHGLPGSGKTTFSQAALERIGAIRIRSDVERKRLFGIAVHESSQSSLGENIYTPEATMQTYERLRDLAQGLVKSGYRVIVDAAFLKWEEREQFRQLAARMRVPFVIASIRADDTELRERIQQRMLQGKDASEANLNVLDALQAFSESLEEEESASTIVFYNSGTNGFSGSDPGWRTLDDVLD
ncbi:MAG: hypothetical protein C4516_08445 [Oxalobacter sp.]|nr:MAG: hypothetical protein C4516_08445 [Oxalobacter sp.]